MYKIASIEKILTVRDHPNADKLSLLTILGWQVVAKRGEFQAGDLVVYIEVDSVLEERPLYEFLRDRNFRVKLIKLRGEVSQGMVFPLSAFDWEQTPDESWIGRSVAQEVGARHYEKPVPGALIGKIKGDFPSFLPKTDEMNLRSYLGALDELQGKECYMSTKLDGTSISYFLRDGLFGACSRNYELELAEGSAPSSLAGKYRIEEKLGSFGKNIAIQGELYGPGVQANRMAIPELDIAIFNLYFIDERRYAHLPELLDFTSQHGIPMVPILWQGLFNFSIEELLARADELRYPNNSPAEGLVIRPSENCYSPTLNGRLSVKVVSEKFLQEFGE